MANPISLKDLPQGIQDAIAAEVARAIATYHPGDVPPAPAETAQETAKRLLGNLHAALNGEQAVVSGSGRVHTVTEELLAHIVAAVFPDEPEFVPEAAPVADGEAI